MNVCGVLAGAYKGKRAKLDVLLTHYEIPGTNDALCGRVQSGGLCDQVVEGPPTCEHCRRRAFKAGKGAAAGDAGIVKEALRILNAFLRASEEHVSNPCAVDRRRHFQGRVEAYKSAISLLESLRKGAL